jgi:hypothetical protein
MCWDSARTPETYPGVACYGVCRETPQELANCPAVNGEEQNVCGPLRPSLTGRSSQLAARGEYTLRRKESDAVVEIQLNS